MDHTKSLQDLENLDLLRDGDEISVAEDERRFRIASMLRKSKLTSRSKRYSLQKDEKNAGGYEKQKVEISDAAGSYHPRKETPFQEIDAADMRGCKEFVICAIMTLVLLLALFALFIVIVYLALPPATPSVAVADIRNGTLSLVTDSVANETVVVAELVILMQATNPLPKAFTTIHYRNGTLIIAYQKISQPISTPSFDQASRNATTFFLARLPHTQLRIGKQMLQNASLEFYEKNITMLVTGTIRADFKILNLLSPHVTVSINCSVRINPVDIWTGRPDLLSKSCL